MDDEDVRQALADRDWWQEFGEQFGWQLFGFTERHVASFRMTAPFVQFDVSRQMRDSIQVVLDKKNKCT